MKKLLTLTVAALLVTATQMAPTLNAEPLAGTTAGTVKVTVHYNGKGKVDASHNVWVWVFDTP